MARAEAVVCGFPYVVDGAPVEVPGDDRAHSGVD